MTPIALPACYIAGRNEAGCDEAGRGCLAGPVYAAAVILPDDFRHPFLNDSKQLTERRRDILRPIIEAEAVAWAVGVVDAAEIDEINILRAPRCRGAVRCARGHSCGRKPVHSLQRHSL